MKNLIEQLKNGCVYHPKRWSGDTADDLGGIVNQSATDDLMNKAADLLEQMQPQWQPIETAPKDGEWILAVNVNNSHRLHIVHYSERHGTLYPWVKDANPMGFVAGLTHWQPLPKPPEV